MRGPVRAVDCHQQFDPLESLGHWSRPGPHTQMS
jgi:hypothetical protein